MVRYSGSLIIRLAHHEGHGLMNGTCHTYAVSIKPKGSKVKPWRGVVGASVYESSIKSADDPTVIDGVARAALSFAEHEGAEVESYADFDDGLGTWLVSRKAVR